MARACVQIGAFGPGFTFSNLLSGDNFYFSVLYAGQQSSIEFGNSEKTVVLQVPVAVGGLWA